MLDSDLTSEPPYRGREAAVLDELAFFEEQCEAQSGSRYSGGSMVRTQKIIVVDIASSNVARSASENAARGRE
jgi:hypothetical protein